MQTVTTTQAKELRRRIKDAGLMELRPGQLALQFGVLFSLFLATTAVAIALPWWAGLMLLPVAVLFLTSAIMHGHDASHRGFSSNKRLNEAFAHFCFPFMVGLGLTYWDRRHNGPHHAYPNLVTEEKRDPDITLWPFAMCVQDHQRSGPLRRWFQANLQHWFFWPLTGLVHFRMRGLSWIYIFRRMKTKGMDAELAVEIGVLLAHFTMWLVIPSLIWGPGWALLVYFLGSTCMSWILSIIFVPGHIGMPLVDGYSDFWSIQLTCSRDFKLPKLVSFFYVGLNYQIEHHLFPTMPSCNLPKAAPIVKQWASELGLPYVEVGWFEGLAASTRFMKTAWKEPRHHHEVAAAAK